ncbi:YggT family protein [Pullulanibacillus sp. KACC 23026]|uniref:YggT family protein n=1 Tax=Pullulanibacillus sp. KACC 23026 TaxID=3028315 RepID=UPI0023B00FC3|nr:YggT family protein [Pullulanibacillus sp. KACC 23026]WEG11650.1 YggT family protein [Pullulanibacillus sp. KACC 23026]
MYLITSIVSDILRIYWWILIIYIFMSWVPNIRQSGVGQLFARLCEPYLEPFRRIIPPLGMIDISPWAAFFVLWLAQLGVANLPLIIQNITG